jgi:hypothetical protein
MDIHLYFLNKEQKKILGDDAENVLQKCGIIASSERKDMREDQDSHDNVCPNCRVKKGDSDKNIVNKIRQTKGDGRVGGNLFGVSGSVSIDTYSVNHCNNCGNEWEKFKTKSISQTHILRVCLNYLVEIMQDPKEKDCDWKVEAIKVFDGCYAETIHHFRKENSEYIWMSTSSYLKLFRIRRYYKSIFDTKNKRVLEKL